MFELKLNNGIILKAGTLAMCQAIQARNGIQDCSYILPVMTAKKTNWKARLIIAGIALITLILI
jgi:hypothetical protein